MNSSVIAPLSSETQRHRLAVAERKF